MAQRKYCLQKIAAAAVCALFAGLFVSCEPISTTEASSSRAVSQQKAASSAVSQIPSSLCRKITGSSAVVLSGLGHDCRSSFAKDPNQTVEETAKMLKTGQPYAGKIPAFPNTVNANDYLGPVFLTMRTKDGEPVKIEPYTYFVTKQQSGANGTEYQTMRHNIENLMEVTVGKTVYYLTSKDFYLWFEKEEWKNEFDVSI